MAYSVLIRDKKDKSIYRFLQIKEEIMEEVPKEVEDPDTHEVRTETELVGTGKFQTVSYKESDKEKFEQKCISLLDTYNRTEIVLVSLEEYDVDLLWNSDLSLIHISEPTRPSEISYAVFCLKKIFLMIRRPPRSTL